MIRPLRRIKPLYWYPAGLGGQKIPQEPPVGRNLKHGRMVFIGKTLILDSQNRANSSKIIEEKWAKAWNFHQKSRCVVILNENFRVRTQKITTNHILARLSRTRPLFIPNGKKQVSGNTYLNRIKTIIKQYSTNPYSKYCLFASGKLTATTSSF